jgi:hypothetical protein
VSGLTFTIRLGELQSRSGHCEKNKIFFLYLELNRYSYYVDHAAYSLYRLSSSGSVSESILIQVPCGCQLCLLRGLRIEHTEYLFKGLTVRREGHSEKKSLYVCVLGLKETSLRSTRYLKGLWTRVNCLLRKPEPTGAVEWVT